MTACDWNFPSSGHPLPRCNALPRASHHQPTTGPGGLTRPIGRVFSCERGGEIALGRRWGDPAAKSAKPQPIRPKSLPTLARTLTLDKRMSGHPVSHQSFSLLGVSIWLCVEGRNMLCQVFTLPCATTGPHFTLSNSHHFTRRHF